MKTILITGASSGIGRALAVRASRAGYGVYAVGRNMKALAALGSQVSEEGGIIRTDVTDVSVAANAPGLVGRMIGSFGHIDVVVNNAGAVAVGPIATQNDEELRVQFGTHVIGPLAIVREALPSLRASRGHVFMLGSGVARIPVGGLGAYPPSKAALRSATTILRRELTPFEIAVTYVDPGAVDTAFMTRAGMPGAPASVLVTPELVARKILFAIETRPRVLNVAPLQAAAVAVAEMLPALTEAILERNPSLVGSGPPHPLIIRDPRTEKIALPPPLPLPGAVDHGSALPPDDEDDEYEDDEDELDDEALAATDVPFEPVPESPPAAEIAPVADAPAAEIAPDSTVHDSPAVAAEPEPPRATRWMYEPPDAADPADAGTTIPPEPPARVPLTLVPRVTDEATFPEPDETPPLASDEEPAATTSSFDAALEPLYNRMLRAKLHTAFVRELLVPDAVLDVSETAMRWAGMPNKHERALTGEVFFALAEWGFLAPRADGRYRVLRVPDGAGV